MRAAVYLRISDDREGRELGVTRQREDCEKLAGRLDATVVEVYQDNDIGASTRSRKRRPDYERMLTDAAAGAFGMIIAYTTNRLTRRPREHEDLIELAEQYGTRYAYVASPSFDLNTSAGRRVARWVAANDAGEAEDISERTSREARQRAERGDPGGGRRAFGYDRTGRVLDEREAPAVEKAYRDTLAGRSLSGIASDLNGAGFTTTMSGREVTIGTGKRRGERSTVSGQWRHNSVRALLLNARNAGLRVYKGAEYPASWPAIVSEDIYRAACAILSRPERRTNGVGNARKWLGARLYRCGRCDTLMISTYRERYQDGRAKRIYRCPACGLSRLAEPIDAWVEVVVAERLSRDDVADLLIPDGEGEDVEQLRADALALRQRREGTLRLLADGTLNEREFKTVRDDIDERLVDVEERLAGVGRGSALAGVLAAPDPVAAWWALEGHVDQRQAVVGALMTVRLLPTGTGRRVFDTASVEIAPRLRA
jgi:site-specific DNA recombinase